MPRQTPPSLPANLASSRWGDRCSRNVHKLLFTGDYFLSVRYFTRYLTRAALRESSHPMRTSHKCASSLQPAFRLVCILATAAGSRDRIPRRAENMQALLRHMCAHARLLYIQKDKGFRICVLSLALSLRDGEPPHCSCAWDGGGGGRCLLLPLFAHSELRRRYVSPAAAALFALPSSRRVLPTHYYPLAVTPPSDLQNIHPLPPTCEIPIFRAISNSISGTDHYSQTLPGKSNLFCLLPFAPKSQQLK